MLHVPSRTSSSGPFRAAHEARREFAVRHFSDDAGQALAEHLLLVAFGMLLLLGLFQLYLAGWTIQRSIGAAHGVLFRQAYRFNCADRAALDACTYDTDTRGKVIWSPRVLPEVEIPVFDIFARHGVDKEHRLWSNSPLNRRSSCEGGVECFEDELEGCDGRPCKRTKLGVGTWMPLRDVLAEAGVRVPLLARPVLAGK